MNAMVDTINNSSFRAATPPPSSEKKKKKAKGSGKSRRRNPVRAAAGHRSVHRRLRTLQRLIPGGKELPANLLFSRTADYILNLRLQVHVLQELSKIYHS